MPDPKRRLPVRADLRGIAGEAQHVGMRRQPVERDAMLDHLRRHPHQSGHAGGATRIARDIKDAERPAVEAVQRPRRAAEEAILLEMVLRAEHDHRTAFGDRGPGGIGSAPRFRPVDLRQQGDALGAVHEGVRAGRVEDHAFGIVKQHHDRTRIERLGQRVQPGQRVLPQPPTLVATALEIGLRHRLGTIVGRGADLLAALP